MDIRPIRTVITGHDEQGLAVVEFDGYAESVFHRPHRPVAMTNIWHLDSIAMDSEGGYAPSAALPFRLAPTEGGAKFRIVQFDPEPSELGDGRRAFSEMGGGVVHVPGATHPYMHRTQTVDFAIVLEGEISMILDNQHVDLVAGDVVVQRATNHAWSNRSGERCLVAFVLIDVSESLGGADQ